MSDPSDLDAGHPGEPSDTDIAIVGMAGRFPGAPDTDALWERVASGDDCLVDLDRDRLIAAGLPAAVVDDDHYVARTGLLDGVDRFDAAFFGIGARDAAVMDPQHRVFLECVWEAIESAALVPERFDGAIGVFAGCGMNTYLINNLITNERLIEQMGWFLLRHTSNDKDFLPTFVSYKLDLHGPSISVQTACSTSLVAMHLAAQSLLSFECDMAVAGGSTIEVPHGVGYTFQEGEILSPDGRCRAFDATSNGTVLTSGAGAVVMRRLTDALDDGDPVLAVMKASAVNNDGARKVSYLAPSVDGHADVIKEALAVSGLSARDISLVDAHGTGTPVGDPIEFAALTEAFRDSTDDVGFCRLTSTKPNIGHLDTAAGVASVIKVIQALRHRTLPPLANFVEPSPLLDLTGSPFSLSGDAAPWPAGAPRRAGVSSLGVGGTNAHVILEEAATAPSAEPSRAEQMLALSGHTANAVDDIAERLAAHLDRHPAVELADVAHTLATGRRAMAHRRIVTIGDRADAAAELRGLSRRRRTQGEALETPPRLAFMFPGGGSQYAGMAQDLDDRFDVFHETLRDAMERVRAAGGPDLTLTMPLDADDAELQRADVSLPSVFVTSVALARQWMAWGATPDALIGHSLGEYVAAHLSGVLSLDDAITLVVTRSRLMAEASGGRPVGMLVISMSADDCTAILPPELSLSVVNSDADCVVAGPLEAVEQFAERLRRDDVESSLLALSAAAHSAVLDPILDEFRAVVSTVTLSAPTIPYLSNLSGDWITVGQATDPQYWVDHLRGTVRFDRCLDTLLSAGPTVLAELGPGHSLSSAARRHDPPPVAAIAGLRHPNDSTPDTAHSLQAFASLWVHGIDVDLDRFTGDRRRRLRLPTYPFQRERHWIEPGDGVRSESVVRGVVDAVAAPPVERIADVRDWFWQPEWTIAPEPTSPAVDRTWTIVGEPGDDLTDAIHDEFAARGYGCVVERFPIDVDAIDSAAVCFVGPNDPDQTGIDTASGRWLDQTLDVIRHLGGSSFPATTFAAVTRGATAVREPARRPVDALVFGPALVAPREYPDLDTVVVDIGAIDEPRASSIVDELIHPAGDVRALRDGARLSPDLVRRPVDAPNESAAPFVHGGTYVITGGLGDIGAEFAMHLATAYGARLALVSSTDVPDEDQWAEWSARHGSAHPMNRRIAKLQRLRAANADVLVVRADTGDPAAMRRALDQVEQRFETIDGAIHAAGHLDDALIELMSSDAHRSVVQPKANGAAVLVNELRDRGAGLLVLVSSTSSFLAAQGQASYVAANSYLDALAGADAGDLRIVTMNSGAWRGVGMAADASRRGRLGIDRGDVVDHPVLSELVRRSDGSIDLIGELSTSRDWIVDGHRTGDGTALLPGTGHLDLALAALREIGEAQATLRDLLIIEALVVPDDADVVLKVSVGSNEGGRRTVTISSDLGSGHQWHLHAQAVADTGPHDDAPLGNRPDADAEMTSVAAHATQRSLVLGPRWNTIVTAAASTTRARADLALDDEFGLDLDAWCAHPALADVALGIGVTLRGDTDNSLFAPVAIESARSMAPLPATASVDVHRVSAGDGVLVVDIDISDPDAGRDAAPALMLARRHAARPRRRVGAVEPRHLPSRNQAAAVGRRLRRTRRRSRYRSNRCSDRARPSRVERPRSRRRLVGRSRRPRSARASRRRRRGRHQRRRARRWARRHVDRHLERSPGSTRRFRRRFLRLRRPLADRHPTHRAPPTRTRCEARPLRAVRRAHRRRTGRADPSEAPGHRRHVRRRRWPECVAVHPRTDESTSRRRPGYDDTAEQPRSHQRLGDGHAPDHRARCRGQCLLPLQPRPRDARRTPAQWAPGSRDPSDRPS